MEHQEGLLLEHPEVLLLQNKGGPLQGNQGVLLVEQQEVLLLDHQGVPLQERQGVPLLENLEIPQKHFMLEMQGRALTMTKMPKLGARLPISRVQDIRTTLENARMWMENASGAGQIVPSSPELLEIAIHFPTGLECVGLLAMMGKIVPEEADRAPGLLWTALNCEKTRAWTPNVFVQAAIQELARAIQEHAKPGLPTMRLGTACTTEGCAAGS